MSKIVVVVRNKQGITGTFTETELKEYNGAYATNNERGELVIHKNTPPDQCEQVLAVFKEWIYWEIVAE